MSKSDHGMIVFLTVVTVIMLVFMIMMWYRQSIIGAMS